MAKPINRIMAKRSKKIPPNPAFDLFGEVPVTWPEVEAWVKQTVGLEPGSPRYEWYVRGWNVPDKVREAKMAAFRTIDLPRVRR